MRCLVGGTIRIPCQCSTHGSRGEGIREGVAGDGCRPSPGFLLAPLRLPSYGNTQRHFWNHAGRSGSGSSVRQPL